MKWSVWIAALLGAALVLSGCSAKTRTTNFRLTVVVETPQGINTGTGVVQQLLRDNNSPFVLPDARGIRTSIRGEAVAVELGEGRVLFALLKDLDPALRQGKIYAREVERTDYPMMVTFGDLDDPTSVVEVDPDDLNGSFGESYALKRITVQVTDEAVTTGIEKRLGWVKKMLNHDTNRDGPFYASYPSKLQYLKRN